LGKYERLPDDARPYKPRLFFGGLGDGRKVRIGTAADVRDRVMQDLPAGIHLRPGELRIEFFGAEDLSAAPLRADAQTGWRILTHQSADWRAR
jgi:hypothetical protein